MKDAFLLNAHPPPYSVCHGTCGYVKQEAAHCARGGLVNEGRHRLHKQAHDKRGIAESLHGYITIGLD